MHTSTQAKSLYKRCPLLSLIRNHTIHGFFPLVYSHVNPLLQFPLLVCTAVFVLLLPGVVQVFLVHVMTDGHSQPLLPFLCGFPCHFHCFSRQIFCLCACYLCSLPCYQLVEQENVCWEVVKEWKLCFYIRNKEKKALVVFWHYWEVIEELKNTEEHKLLRGC